MRTWVYRAQSSQGVEVEGTRQAVSKPALIKALEDEHYFVIGAQVKRDPIAVEDILSRYSKPKKDRLAAMFRSLEVMLKAAMSPLQAFTLLAAQEEHVKLREAQQQIADDLSVGETLANAMRKHPHIFSEIYTTLIEVGEETGSLDEALKTLSVDANKAAALARALKKAKVYPYLVCGICFMMISGLLLFMIPRFAKIYKDIAASVGTPQHPIDASLPPLTRGALTLSHLLYPPSDQPVSVLGILHAGPGKSPVWMVAVLVHFVGLVALVLGVRYAFRRALQNDDFRLAYDRFKLRIPFGIGTLILKLGVARFSRTLHTLIAAGVDNGRALEMTAPATGNLVLEAAITAAAERQREGKPMAPALEEGGAFPRMATGMISVGETSGDIESMLKQIAELYEGEVDLMVDGLTSLIEPLLILIIGAVVGVAVLSIYMPMFHLYSLLNAQH